MNNRELKAAIARSGLTNQTIALELGLSAQGLYNKLSGNSEFKGSEIKHLAEILQLSISEVNNIFFSIK